MKEEDNSEYKKTIVKKNTGNDVPKFESSMLNGVAINAKTHIHTHTYCQTQVIPKKKIFRGD